MRREDRDMLATMLDMSDIRVGGERLRPITSTAQEVVGNRKNRRADQSNRRRKKKKFGTKK